MKPLIQVIIASTRPGRSGKAVADWFMDQVKDYDQLEFELIDLTEVNLPFLDEAIPPSAHNYQNEHTKAWAERIGKADGYVWVTAEYNHGYPAPLKNAIDFIYQEWNHKPVAFVSYGSAAGGQRAVEQLIPVASELKMAAMRPRLTIHNIWEHVADDKLDGSAVQGDPAAFLEELAWWTHALKAARVGASLTAQAS